MKTKSNKQTKKQNPGLSFRPESSGGAESNNTNTVTQADGQCGSHPAPAQPETEQAKPARVLPYVNYQQREENRALPTEQVLDMLRQWVPQAYDLAEVVGKWVWITFPEPPAEQLRGQLSQFGFHWNNVRKCWQHPCGQFATEGSGQDPRTKYGSHFAADLRAA
jgi:hypothetical protein